MYLLVITITPSEQPFRRSYNFKKANLETFTTNLDNGITSLASPSSKAYKSFRDLVRLCACKCIPRGCRAKYIGLTPASCELMKHYQELFDADPFSADTIEAGTNLKTEINIKITCTQRGSSLDRRQTSNFSKLFTST